MSGNGVPTLTEPNDEVRKLLNAALDGVVLIDHLGRILGFNRAAEQLFGYRARELLGSNVTLLMAEQDRTAHLGHLARYLATRVPHIIGKAREVSARRKDGSIFPVLLSVGALLETEPPRFVGFIQDMTRRRPNEAQARRLQERLWHVSRLATVAEMASGIAHQLNQPLAAIANYAQACDRLLARADADHEEVRGALKEITAQALRAGDIIRRLRELARHPDGQLEPTDVNALIGDLTDLVMPDIRRHQLQYQIELGDGLPRVRVHQAQIQRVVLELVHNAVEALAGSTAEPRKITVRTSCAADGSLEVAICDSGPGVPAGLVPTLFDPFCTSRPDAPGLGLAIGRTIMRRHHGALDYRPNVPLGACFTLRFPLRLGDET